jgi:hypothetical protein
MSGIISVINDEVRVLKLFAITQTISHSLRRGKIGGVFLSECFKSHTGAGVARGRDRAGGPREVAPSWDVCAARRPLTYNECGDEST